MDIESFREEQLKYYNIEDYKPETLKMKNINPEIIIPQLCFIVHYLNSKGYNLSHICMNDFEMTKYKEKDYVLLLKKDTHIYSIDSDGFYVYKKKEDNGICFPYKTLQEGKRANITDTYASVGLFVYYMFFKKVKNELSEKDYGKLVGTKPYYFIKNTMSAIPCLLYL